MEPVVSWLEAVMVVELDVGEAMVPPPWISHCSKA